MTERVRLMKLEAGTKISKHTDKVDKDIKSRKIIRLHIPVITDDQIKMISWLEKDNPTEFKMKKGECWWLDVSKAHSVLNESDILPLVSFLSMQTHIHHSWGPRCLTLAIVASLPNLSTLSFQ